MNDIQDDTTFGAFMTLIRPRNEKLLPKLLYHFLKSEPAKAFYLANANTTTNISNLKFEDLGNFQIPLPPLSIQEEIVAEIEGYQKIIDGAKAVVANYKPKIDIDPEWGQKKLGEISDLKNGLNFSKESTGELIKIVGVGNFKNHLVAPVDELEKIQVNESISDSYLLKKGDVLFVRSNGNKDLVGRSMVMPEINERISFSGFTIRCRLNSGINPFYIGYLLKSDFHRQLMKSVGRGANIRNLSQGILKDIIIPVPSLEFQNQIVTDLTNEQNLVNTNKQLSEIFEQKIKDRIAKVWGINTNDSTKNNEEITGNSAQSGTMYKEDKKAIDALFATIDYDYEVAAIQLLSERRFGFTYGKKYTHKMFSNIEMLNTLPKFKDLVFEEKGWGMFSKAIANTIDRKRFICFNKLDSGAEVLKVKSSAVKEVIDWMSQKENTEFVAQVNNMLSIYEKPLIDKDMNRIELFNTVLECMKILETDNPGAIRSKMDEWRMYEENYQFKSEKFNENETFHMIQFIKSEVTRINNL
jgi:restriction endonuclease S subunit